MVGIGDKKQIRLEKYVSTKDASGDFKETVQKWNLWASVTRNGGGRSSLNGQTGLTNTILFEVYWKPTIYPTGNFRVVYNGRKHTVNSIEEKDERRFMWVITAESTSKK